MSTRNIKTFMAIMLILNCAVVESSRILVVAPKAQKSHTLMFEGIVTALAMEGHYVTFVTPREFKHSLQSLQTILLTEELTKYTEVSKKSDFINTKMSAIQTWAMMCKSAARSLDAVLMNPNITEIMISRSFDLVIVEMFYTEALIGLGQHFDAPVIVVSTFGASQQTNDLVGNPSPLSYVPHVDATFSSKMGLLDRMINLALETTEKIILNVYNIPFQVKRSYL